MSALENLLRVCDIRESNLLKIQECFMMLVFVCEISWLALFFWEWNPFLSVSIFEAALLGGKVFKAPSFIWKGNFTSV